MFEVGLLADGGGEGGLELYVEVLLVRQLFQRAFELGPHRVRLRRNLLHSQTDLILHLQNDYCFGDHQFLTGNTKRLQ